jgi:phosphoglycerate kinase
MDLSDISGERVLLRADLNVPLEDGEVKGMQRLRAVSPTIRQLLEQNNAIIITSHLGRPEGRQKKYSLKPVARALSTLIKTDIVFASDALSKRTASIADKLEPGQVLMLENLRYYPEEEANDPSFAAHLASLATVYVNDAFSVSHRAHASVVGIPEHLPSAFGLNILAEIEAAERLLEPKKPALAIIGGAKISTKLGLLESLSKRYSSIIIGGAMAFTLLKAQGVCVGRSKTEEAMIPQARRLLTRTNLILPTDVVVARSVSAHAKRTVKPIDEIDPEDIGLDIGPASVALFSKHIAKSRTIVWNGPMGLFELPPFAKGTYAIARILADSKAIVVIGGGDTVAAIERIRLQNRYDHVSTGGGAMLEYLERAHLPGIDAIRQRSGRKR